MKRHMIEREIQGGGDMSVVESCGASRAPTQAVHQSLAVTSRKVVGLFFEQLWLQFVPVLHRLQGGLAAQG